MPVPPFPSSSRPVIRNRKWHPVLKNAYYADAAALRIEVARPWWRCMESITIVEGIPVGIRGRYATVRDAAGREHAGKVVAYRK